MLEIAIPLLLRIILCDGDEAKLGTFKPAKFGMTRGTKSYHV